jgi:hypothetical protein
MDYSPFQFCGTAGRQYPTGIALPRISHYDFWAIEWGYRRFYQFKTPEEELPFLNQWTIDHVKNPFLRFNGRAESGLNDPRAHVRGPWCQSDGNL